MTFDDLLAQICDLLQRQGRVSYWALQIRNFQQQIAALDDILRREP